MRDFTLSSGNIGNHIAYPANAPNDITCHTGNSLTFMPLPRVAYYTSISYARKYPP